MTDDERRDRWSILVAQVAVMPGVAPALLAEHVPAGRYCRACSLPEAGPVAWPCTLYRLAQAALGAAQTA